MTSPSNDTPVSDKRLTMYIRMYESCLGGGSEHAEVARMLRELQSSRALLASQAAEIGGLKEELAIARCCEAGPFQAYADKLREELRRMTEDRDRHVAKLAAAERDAGRYRWLKDNCVKHYEPPSFLLEWAGDTNDMDAAIDAAGEGDRNATGS